MAVFLRFWANNNKAETNQATIVVYHIRYILMNNTIHIFAPAHHHHPTNPTNPTKLFCVQGLQGAKGTKMVLQLWEKLEEFDLEGCNVACRQARWLVVKEAPTRNKDPSFLQTPTIYCKCLLHPLTV